MTNSVVINLFLLLSILSILQFLNVNKVDIVVIATNDHASTTILEIPLNLTSLNSQNPYFRIDNNVSLINKLPDFMPHNKDDSRLKTCIVHLPAINKPSLFLSHEEWHTSIVASTTSVMTKSTPLKYNGYEDTRVVSSIKGRLLYSYNYAMEGFSVSLTREEVEALGKMPEVMLITEDMIYEPQTTRTPSFLKLFFVDNMGNVPIPIGPLFKLAKGGSDVIVGIIDSGIWPERQSFKDDNGYSPIPPRWKGVCDNADTFQGQFFCNRKLIGARAFYKGFEASTRPSRKFNEYMRSPRDRLGHGTHCASIVGGSPVANASFFGYALGSASGMAPNSRLAIYKACWEPTGCNGVDILRAIDVAISDGVDVLSISLIKKNRDSSNMRDYLESPIHIGTSRAIARGIISIAGAGNHGPMPFTVENVAPWIITVAASTLDRDYPIVLTLGDRLPIHTQEITYIGSLLYVGQVKHLTQKELPLVDGGNCNFPNPIAMHGAIVLCWDYKDDIAKSAIPRALTLVLSRAACMLYVVGREDLLVTPPPSEMGFSGTKLAIPIVVIGREVGGHIRQYVSREAKPTMKLGLKQGSPRIGFQEAPSIASFSSRGPTYLSWPLIKPDVAAPGVNILGVGNLHKNFVFESGTSLATAHVAGIVALLKAARPTWSPAMIQSAIITSASTLDNQGNHIIDVSSGNFSTPMAMGAGIVNPNSALDPGLVYDSHPSDYVDFLCSLGYSSTLISILSNDYMTTCSKPIKSLGYFNYPSFNVVYLKSQAQRGAPTSFIFSRWLTNVSPFKSNYTLNIIPPAHVHVDVSPKVLSFNFLYEDLSYTLTFTPDPSAFNIMSSRQQISLGSITWDDGDGGHLVRSPIMFSWYNDK